MSAAGMDDEPVGDEDGGGCAEDGMEMDREGRTGPRRRSSIGLRVTESGPSTSDEPYAYQYHDGSFREYMRQKNAKLDTQYEAHRRRLVGEGSDSGGGNHNNALAGCTVMVNGRCAGIEFAGARDMVLKNGGTFVNYMSERVTHIIAETLPTAKVQQLRKRRQTRKVGTPAGAPGGRHIEAVHYVTTQWLLDSVRDGKKATEGRYMCVLPSPTRILSPTMAV